MSRDSGFFVALQSVDPAFSVPVFKIKHLKLKNRKSKLKDRSASCAQNRYCFSVFFRLSDLTIRRYLRCCVRCRTRVTPRMRSLCSDLDRRKCLLCTRGLTCPAPVVILVCLFSDLFRYNRSCRSCSFVESLCQRSFVHNGKEFIMTRMMYMTKLDAFNSYLTTQCS